MSIVNDILQKVGLKFEDLTAAERETLMSWTQALESNQLTVDMVKSYVHSLLEGVENELGDVGYNVKQDIFLKARLRNLRLLEGFLTSPEKAKQSIDRAIAGIVSKPR